MTQLNPNDLIRQARAIIDRASDQGRDLSEFESGRCDALLEIARREKEHADSQTNERER